jgi:hypothetical protein
MSSHKFELARQSASCGIDASTLINLSDLVEATKHVISSAPGLKRRQVNQCLNLLRKSVSAICGALGEGTTQATLLIQDLIDRSAEINERLNEIHLPRESARHSNHLRLLLAFARGMGFSHGLFAVEKEWEELPFLGTDNIAQLLINDLMRKKVRPEDVTHKHLADWRNERREKGYSIAQAGQAISNLKLRIRNAGLGTRFSKLDTSSARQEPHRLAIKNMSTPLRLEVGDFLGWFAKQDAAGIIRMCKYTRENNTIRLEKLCGFAPRVVPDLGEVKSLQQILNREVITAYARWLINTEKANRESIKTLLYGLHSLLNKHPSFADQDWSWIPELLSEFPQEPESVIEARRQERAFDYDYGAISSLPEAMQKRRESCTIFSEVEIGRMLHDELLMQWLAAYPLQPRCMYECRLNGDHPNLFGGTGKIHLLAEHVKGAASPYLRGDEPWFLRFAAEEVPNRCAIEAPLLLQLITPLKRYLQYRPLLIPESDPGTLFLNREGGKLTRTTFCLLVGDVTERYLGRRIPPSAFRDISAYKWLANRPSDYATLASIRCASMHSVRMRFDPDYRREQTSRSRRGGTAA